DSTPQTEAALRHLAGVLLHQPSVRARELARDGRTEEFTAGIDALFGIRSAIVTEIGDAESASA
ncbi:MAG: glutamyl-tRNA reductase, partial [Actinomycetota bacterium]|nr:glutamyl-tRNA reductase [Actinomycetota bacterium]